MAKPVYLETTVTPSSGTAGRNLDGRKEEWATGLLKAEERETLWEKYRIERKSSL